MTYFGPLVLTKSGLLRVIRSLKSRVETNYGTHRGFIGYLLGQLEGIGGARSPSGKDRYFLLVPTGMRTGLMGDEMPECATWRVATTGTLWPL